MTNPIYTPSGRAKEYGELAHHRDYYIKRDLRDAMEVGDAT